MGYHPNYYKVITNLIQWKDEFNRVSDKKFEKLKKVLQQFTYSDEDDYESPSNKDIASIMGIPHLILNKLLKEFYGAIIEDFQYKPLKIKECVQMITISIPFDEQKADYKKQSSEFYFKHSVQ